MLKSDLDFEFDVIHAATGHMYANDNDIKLVNLGPIALFGSYKLTTNSGKHLEDISQARIFSLMHELITSAKDTQDLSIGFDRDRNRGQRELTNNRTKKGI